MSGPNGEAEVIDVEAQEVPAVPDMGALVPTGGPTLAVTPSVKATELVERLDVIREAQDKAMVKDIDYGVIPGTKKPTLLKPGAEKLSVLFQLDVQLHNEKRWEDGGHLTVISKATAFHAPTRTRLGYGEGICTTREKKYGKRTQQRTCPGCGAETIFASKKDGGFFCWKKKGGCGAQFAESDPQIVGQEVGEIDNPDLPDLWNTVVKMAEKRARVDVVLAVTGASALFTQDIEDGQSSPDQERTQAADPPKPKLDPETVAPLVDGIKELKLDYGKIALLLGSVQADGLPENSAEGVFYALSSMTKAQAAKFGAELARMKQDAAATQAQDGGS